MRWAAPAGLRTLVRDLLAELLPPAGARPRGARDLDELDHDAVVLAMPDPQAARLAGVAATAADRRSTTSPSSPSPLGASGGLVARGAAFVNDDPDLSLVADDGARRGDGAAVLVAHSTAELAGRHLDDPDRGAVAPVARRGAPGARTRRRHPPGRTPTAGPSPSPPPPTATRRSACSTTAARWAAAPTPWCPEGSPRVEAAWLSGDRLGIALAGRLT